MFKSKYLLFIVISLIIVVLVLCYFFASKSGNDISEMRVINKIEKKEKLLEVTKIMGEVKSSLESLSN